MGGRRVLERPINRPAIGPVVLIRTRLKQICNAIIIRGFVFDKL